jgi:GTPase SAR1 family protein
MHSFKNLTKWLIELDRYTSDPNFVVVCVGNKADLNINREVSYQTAQNFCYQYGFEYIETSAKTGDNVQEAFDLLVGNIVEAMENPIVRRDSSAAGFTLTSDSGNKNNKNTKNLKNTKSSSARDRRRSDRDDESSQMEQRDGESGDDEDGCC